jgi:hypothetical protein
MMIVAFWRGEDAALNFSTRATMKEFPDSRILDFGPMRLAAWPVIAIMFRHTIGTFFQEGTAKDLNLIAVSSC